MIHVQGQCKTPSLVAVKCDLQAQFASTDLRD